MRGAWQRRRRPSDHPRCRNARREIEYRRGSLGVQSLHLSILPTSALPSSGLQIMDKITFKAAAAVLLMLMGILVLIMIEARVDARKPGQSAPRRRYVTSQISVLLLTRHAFETRALMPRWHVKQRLRTRPSMICVGLVAWQVQSSSKWNTMGLASCFCLVIMPKRRMVSAVGRAAITDACIVFWIKRS